MNVVSRLIEACNRSRLRVVVIGDAMLDKWVHGKEVILCQDECCKLVQDNVVFSAGGAANAANCLSGWDVIVEPVVTNERDWPTKTRFVGPDGNILFRWDDDKSPSLYQQYTGTKRAWAYKLALDMVGCADAVLLSDYDKGFLTRELIHDVSEICKQRDVPCVADCKRSTAMYPHCILKCNEHYQKANNDELSEMVYDADEPQQLVVTAGPLNPAVWDLGKVAKGFPYLPYVKCVNHVGAGDCFAAHLALALAHKFSLKDAAMVAHSAGRVYVQHPHNKPPLPREVEADLSSAV